MRADLRGRFERATGQGVTVAVVDSGWSETRADPRVLEVLSAVPDAGRPEGAHPRHGTICALRVLQAAPRARIQPIRVFARGIETSVPRVCEGIRLAREQGVDVINLSLATRLREAIEPLFEACEAARREGIVVVAAAHNRGVPAVPAFLEPVLSVEEGRQVELLDFGFDPDGMIECSAAGARVPVVDRGGSRYRRAGSSIAAATVSGLVARLREVQPRADLDEVRTMLTELTTNRGAMV